MRLRNGDQTWPEMDEEDDIDGTAAEADFSSHFVTTVAGMFMLGMMNVGAYNFFTQFFDLTKDDFGDNCDLDAVDKGAYSGVNAIVQ